MPNKNGYFDTDNRQLTDVFRELQQTRLQYENQNAKKHLKLHLQIAIHIIKKM